MVGADEEEEEAEDGEACVLEADAGDAEAREVEEGGLVEKE